MKIEINKKKKIVLIVSIIALILSVIGVTFAMFSYVRNSNNNTLQAGRIVFSSTQTYLELNNALPTTRTNLNSSNSDTATITLKGDTMYTRGIEYKVTIEEVNNTINGKELPISFQVTATNLGTKSTDYYNERGSTTNVYKLTEEGDAYNGKYVIVGFIKSDTTGVDGSIDITAYIDTNKIVISDTESENDSGAEIFTTTEWNSFDSSNPLSFKVKVEAREGTWVEPEKFLTMKNLSSIQAWKDIRANITSIEFHKDGVAPANPVTSFDVTNTTSDASKGSITLYTVDDGLGNNTYKAIVVANDTIYAPEDSSGMFRDMKKLSEFHSNNLRVDNVISMNSMFYGCYTLKNVDFTKNWNTSNVQIMTSMFASSYNINDISGLSNWNTEKVTSMNSMFNIVGMSNLDALSNWNVKNVLFFRMMFSYCEELEDTSGINNWNLNSSASFNQMFVGVSSHPTFTKFPNGTWDENGTFTPNA